MQKCNDLLNHIDKVKALADYIACLEVYVSNEDVVTILLESLPPLYDHLITAYEGDYYEVCDNVFNTWDV